MIVVVPPHAAAGAGLERVGGERAAERQLHMGVHVDAAGDHVLPAGIDHLLGGRRGLGEEPRRADGGDLPVDQHVGGDGAGQGDDLPVQDQRVPSVSPSPGDDLVVGVGAPVTIERPPVSHLADLAEVEVPHDRLRLVRIADLADELAFGIDEVALAVEVVVAQGSIPTRLIAPTKYMFATAAAGCSSRQMYSLSPRCVALGLKTISAPFRPSTRQPSMTVVADVDADHADGRLETGYPPLPGAK